MTNLRKSCSQDQYTTSHSRRAESGQKDSSPFRPLFLRVETEKEAQNVLFLRFNRHFCGFYANSAFIMSIFQVAILCPFTTLMTFMTFTTFFTTTTTNIRYIRAFSPTPRQVASRSPPPARRKITILWAKMTIFRKKCAFFRLFSPFAPSFRPLPPFLPSLFSPPPPPSGKMYHILSTRVVLVYHNSVYVMRGLLSLPPALYTWRVKKWRENAPALRFPLSPNSTRGKH